MKDKIINWLRPTTERFIGDHLTLENRLSNLIMLCTWFGCIFAFVFSLLINQSWGQSITVLAGLIIVTGCLYVGVWRNKPKVAALMVILLINELLFPFMFIACGGIHSGMICWFIVGLIFPFLVLTGPICIIVFVIGAITLGGCFVLEYFGIIPSHPLVDLGWVEDAVQSMILVAIVFGVIFKFQTYVYSKQNKELLEREEALQEAMKELERVSNAKSDFLANMSHEIRTPINAIMGMNELVLRESKDDNVTQNSIKIQSASENLLSIINDILDFSKIESGKMELIPVDYQLSSTLNDLYNVISMRASNKGLGFEIVNNPDIPERLHGDEFRIRQVVSNFLTNAVKYTKEGHVELAVSYEKVDATNLNLIFEVKDTGVGISEDDIGKLFESFQRIDEIHNRTIEGTGLGLTITKKLVEQMEGSIQVESKLGQGSVFTAIIPQTYSGDETIGEFAKRHEEFQKNKGVKYKELLHAPDARILVVDDIRINLTVVKGLLKNTEVKSDLALSGIKALQMMEKTKYDLVFLDHMMPELDGIETLKRLRSGNSINAATPVVALTANAIKGAEEEYLAAGFNDYLSKPVHGEDLEKMLIKYLPKDKLQIESVNQ